jgi:GAF domain-containing protein
MQPLPETNTALNEYMGCRDTAERAQLMRLGRDAKHVVPELVGLSVTILEDDITFTLVASGSPPAGSAPGPAPVEASRPVPVAADAAVYAADVLDEQRWRALATAGSPDGVASSLTMPMLEGERAVVGLDLYASTANAFEGHHEELAQVLGASPSGIVSNADLSFSSRLRALEAPGRLQDRNDVEVAMGHLAATHALELEDARRLILHVAARAGVTPGQAARVLRHFGFAL